MIDPLMFFLVCLFPELLGLVIILVSLRYVMTIVFGGLVLIIKASIWLAKGRKVILKPLFLSLSNVN